MFDDGFYSSPSAYAPPSIDRSGFQPGGDELTFGTMSSSDVTVEEVVVWASPGGGYDIWANNQDYAFFTQDPEPSTQE